MNCDQWHCSGLVDTSESDDAIAQPRSFDRLIVNSPSTSASKTTTSDTEALINQTILQCWDQKQGRRSIRQYTLYKNVYKGRRYAHST